MNTVKGDRFTKMQKWLHDEYMNRAMLLKRYGINKQKDYYSKSKDDPERPQMPYIVLFVRNPEELPDDDLKELISCVRVMRSEGISMVCVCDREIEKELLLCNIGCLISTEGEMSDIKPGMTKNAASQPASAGVIPGRAVMNESLSGYM